jgi:hypothetical protein
MLEHRAATHHAAFIAGASRKRPITRGVRNVAVLGRRSSHAAGAHGAHVGHDFGEDRQFDNRRRAGRAPLKRQLTVPARESPGGVARRSRRLPLRHCHEHRRAYTPGADDAGWRVAQHGDAGGGLPAADDRLLAVMSEARKVRDTAVIDRA